VGIKRVLGREHSDAAVISDSLVRPQAFEVIFERHFEAIHRYLARRVGGGRADDLASTTFVVAFERRDGFRDEASSARPWLFGIATNVLRNDQRAERRAISALARAATDAERGQAEDGELGGSDLAGLVAALEVQQRDVLVLYAWEGLSYREIAVALGVPVGTVRSRLARARARLRGGLDAGRPVRAPADVDPQEVSDER
jgi:RNA polymerase sigma-70 factor (ECF subfamily)